MMDFIQIFLLFLFFYFDTFFNNIIAIESIIIHIKMPTFLVFFNFSFIFYYLFFFILIHFLITFSRSDRIHFYSVFSPPPLSFHFFFILIRYWIIFSHYVRIVNESYWNFLFIFCFTVFFSFSNYAHVKKFVQAKIITIFHENCLIIQIA